MYLGRFPLIITLTHIYVYIWGDKQRTCIGVIISGSKRRYLQDRKLVKDSKPGLKIGALCHIFPRY